MPDLKKCHISHAFEGFELDFGYDADAAVTSKSCEFEPSNSIGVEMGGSGNLHTRILFPTLASISLPLFPPWTNRAKGRRAAAHRFCSLPQSRSRCFRRGPTEP